MNKNLQPVSITNYFGVKSSAVFYEEWTRWNSGQSGKNLP